MHDFFFFPQMLRFQKLVHSIFFYWLSDIIIILLYMQTYSSQMQISIRKVISPLNAVQALLRVKVSKRKITFPLIMVVFAHL